MTRLRSLLACLLVLGCADPSPRRIRIAAAASGGPVVAASSVVRARPAARRHAVALLRFENATGDPDLDWLRRGISDMLAAELGQSSFLELVAPARLDAVLAESDRSADELFTDAVAAGAARDAGVETAVTGRFRREGGELVLDTELREIASGAVVRREQVRGPGLDHVLTMVSELSRRFRDDLRGDLEEARAHGLEVSEMTGSIEAFRHYSRALEHIERYLHAEADRELAQAVAADPAFAAAHLRYAETRLHLGDLEGGLGEIELARRHAGRLSRSQDLRLRLWEADLSGDPDATRAVREELYENAPRDVEARTLAAQQLYALGEVERAIEEYELLLELDPRLRTAHNMLGYLHAERGDYNTGLRYLERYRELAPEEPNAHDSIGEVLMMAGRFEEAVSHFRSALARWPDFWNSARELSIVHAELGRLEPALEYARRWHEVAPSPRHRLNAGLGLATVLWRFGRPDEAIAAARDARADLPQALEPLWLEALIEDDRGDPEAAARVRREVLARVRAAAAGPQDLVALEVLLGISFYGLLPPEEVLPVLEAVAGWPLRGAKASDVALHRGLALLRAGQAERARELLRAETGRALARLVELRKFERSEGWRFVVDVVAHEPRYLPESHDVLDAVREAARRAPRPDLEALVLLVEAQYADKYRREVDVARIYRDLGLPRESAFVAAGPFRAPDAFLRPFPPELETDCCREGFRPVVDEVADGWVDLARALGGAAWSAGYAALDVVSPEQRVVQLRLGSDEDVKLWLNGDLVWQAYRKPDDLPYASKPDARLDHDVVQVVLRPGRNRVLLKVTNTLADWGFVLRVTDDRGRGFPDLELVPPAP